MYCDYFNLKSKPFSLTPDLDFFYMGRQHEQALSSFKYGIEQKLGMMLLTGEVGAGKTTLSRVLISRLGENVSTALLFNPILDMSELLREVTKDFGIKSRFTSVQKQIEGLNKFLLNLTGEGKIAVLVIDESQNLSDEVLEMIRMLTNLETDKEKLLQVVLVGQPELNQKLAKHNLRQLDQRISTRVNLEPFTFTDMMRYINHRLCVAGGGGKIFFEPNAYKRIYKESKGYPRLINLLCDRSLMASFVHESYVINKSMVDQAVDDWRGGAKGSVIDRVKGMIKGLRA